ncbi:DUF1963 domain-containing protein [Muricauda sp. HICW]|uniref:DUF1963 domain-containing protein n=1 Tax=Flagellimonas chongwuensis TaxID=2697365 RepID=A0A850NB66_9FLAO|nr:MULTISPECIES: DUF1963 domain-containing protein [Allomuricauda]NVN17903.1 DUF1963 domain-containing protein [Allomuricauda chongwuensis]
MNVLAKAKAAIDGFDFNEANIEAFNESAGTELSSESLKDYLKNWLKYYLVPQFEMYGSEEEVPLGTTKLYGLPHLPDSLEFPEDMIFAGQFNLAEIKPHDIFNEVPKDSGIYYFFVDVDGVESEVFFYDGPVDDLKIREYPNGDEYGKSQVMDLRGKSEELYMQEDLIGWWIKAKDKYSDCHLATIMGADILERLEGLLQKEAGSFTLYDHLGSLPDEYFFGKPRYYQGEDGDDPNFYPSFFGFEPPWNYDCFLNLYVWQDEKSKEYYGDIEITS